MTKIILAAKSKSKKDLLVHQQLLCDGVIKGNIIKLRETLVATNHSVAVCVIRHNQVVTTAQEPKGQSCSTKGKLVGKVRRLQIETIRSQVLNCLNMTARTQFRDSMVMGRQKRLKIESVPTEMWSSRGMIYICCYMYQESLRNYHQW
jgi:hypothetical protein